MKASLLIFLLAFAMLGAAAQVSLPKGKYESQAGGQKTVWEFDGYCFKKHVGSGDSTEVGAYTLDGGRLSLTYKHPDEISFIKSIKVLKAIPGASYGFLKIKFFTDTSIPFHFAQCILRTPDLKPIVTFYADSLGEVQIDLYNFDTVNAISFEAIFYDRILVQAAQFKGKVTNVEVELKGQAADRPQREEVYTITGPGRGKLVLTDKKRKQIILNKVGN